MCLHVCVGVCVCVCVCGRAGGHVQLASHVHMHVHLRCSSYEWLPFVQNTIAANQRTFSLLGETKDNNFFVI